MKIKLRIKDVKTHEDKVLAMKIYYYIDNAMKHPEWLLSEEAKNFNYETEWNNLANCFEIEKV